MAVRVIPLRSDLENYRARGMLDGKRYTLAFRWNVRDEAWYFSLYDTNEQPLILNRKLVVNMPLLMRGRSDAFPPGELMAQDSGGSGLSPGRDELGKRVQLLYADAAELA